MHRNRAIHVAALACALLAACSDDAPSRPPAARPRQAAASQSRDVSRASSGAAASDACGAGDAHLKHADMGYGCAVCHACGGNVVFGTVVTFPQGTSSAGGTVSGGGATTTCSVGCHAPLGAPLQPVAWNAGPQACTSCHRDVAVAGTGTIRSSHSGEAAIDSTTCASCHDQSQHTRGQVHLIAGDGSIIANPSCAGCHAGQGQTLGGTTPPLLVGWSDTVKGDFHGDRPGTCRFDHLDAAGQRTGAQGALPCPGIQPQAPNALRITSRWWYQSGTSGAWAWTCDIETVDASGTRIAPTLTRQPCPAGTVLNSSCSNPAYPAQCYPTTLVTRGFGGTLLAPYARGASALPCTACHDFHFSSNAFLLASTVNGTSVPSGAIDRAGVGAQGLCNACHAGDRHQICKDCHKQVWTTDGEYSWFEGDPVDPAPDGSACFYCHGHEGLLHMRDPSPQWPGGGHPWGLAGADRTQDACSHCHSTWAPPATEYVAPAFATWLGGDPVVSGVTATTATVTWKTDEPATSYVEYGIGVAGWVAGDNALVCDHQVALSGLTPGATYEWRVRSSDAFRNVTITAPRTFVTPGPLDVPRPDIAQVGVSATVGTYSTTTSLVWFPVVAPSGTSVEYEVQLASDPGFTSLANGSIAGPGVPGTTVGDSGWVSGTPTASGGRPALSLPATITNIPQDSCGDIVPNVYYWRVRARDAQGRVSEWSTTGTFGAFAGDPWC